MCLHSIKTMGVRIKKKSEIRRTCYLELQLITCSFHAHQSSGNEKSWSNDEVKCEMVHSIFNDEDDTLCDNGNICM